MIETKRHGNVGRKQSSEHIAKRIASYAGKPLSKEHRKKLAAIERTPEWRAKISRTLTGRKHTEEEKRKIKESVLRAYATPEVKAKFIDRVVWNKGKPWSEEIRKQMSIARKGKPNLALKGKPRSEETRKKLSIAAKGRSLSEETKRKISLANKGKHLYRENRRRGPDHPFYGKQMPKGTGAGKGSYCAAGHWVRSSWERGVADWLFKQKIAYEYEPQLFDFGDGLRYRPDFYLLPPFDRWYEVKGYMTERAKRQIAAFRATGRSLFVIDRRWWRQYTNGRDDLPREYMAA